MCLYVPCFASRQWRRRAHVRRRGKRRLRAEWCWAKWMRWRCPTDVGGRPIHVSFVSIHLIVMRSLKCMMMSTTADDYCHRSSSRSQRMVTPWTHRRLGSLKLALGSRDVGDRVALIPSIAPHSWWEQTGRIYRPLSTPLSSKITERRESSLQRAHLFHVPHRDIRVAKSMAVFTCPY